MTLYMYLYGILASMFLEAILSENCSRRHLTRETKGPSLENNRSRNQEKCYQACWSMQAMAGQPCHRLFTKSCWT